MNVVDLMRAPELLGSAFTGTSWDAWEAVHRGAFALDMTEEQRKTFAELAGGRTPPTDPVKELLCCVGRRGGKTETAALIAIDAALFRSYQLAPGEVPVVMCLAVDRRQSQILIGYVRGLLNSSPLLAKRIVRDQSELLEVEGLDGQRVRIEVHTSSFRSVRGHTVVAAILDECCFYWDERSQNPDVEIVAALKPAMATVPNSLLVAISSPFRRSGWLFEQWAAFYGVDDPHTLVIQAPPQNNIPEPRRKVG